MANFNNNGDIVTVEMVIDYVEKNPMVMYGDYNDSLSHETANQILCGDMDSVSEWVMECENFYMDHAWSDYMDSVAQNFEYDSYKDMPEDLQNAAAENYHVDSSDFVRTCLRNCNANIVATLKKRNGDMIEFPAWDYDAKENARLQRYLKESLGIDGRKAEATYSGTYLRVLGQIDLYDVYKSGKVPTHIKVTERDFFIGVESMNGSGTCGDCAAHFTGSKTFKATFQVDNGNRYGVDSIYGLSRTCWQNDLNTKTK